MITLTVTFERADDADMILSRVADLVQQGYTRGDGWELSGEDDIPDSFAATADDPDNHARHD
jgi:hypothetical protein